MAYGWDVATGEDDLRADADVGIPANAFAGITGAKEA